MGHQGDLAFTPPGYGLGGNSEGPCSKHSSPLTSITCSIITGAVPPVPIWFTPLPPLWGTWEAAAETDAGPLATSLDPADEESGLVTSGALALGGICPDAMGGVGRGIDPDPLLEEPAGVWAW